MLSFSGLCSSGAPVSPREAFAQMGSNPPADSIVHTRLITAVNSKTAQQGQRVEAVVSTPLFSADRKLILPEGTHLIGAVTAARRAKSFHRGGQLRFSFRSIELPNGLAPNLHRLGGKRVSSIPTATVSAAESSGKTAVKVDDEGGIKAVEPKTRFIAPAIAAIIAAKSMDNDTERVGTHDGNIGGRTLGGGSGLGLLGAMAAQASPTLGSVSRILWDGLVALYERNRNRRRGGIRSERRDGHTFRIAKLWTPLEIPWTRQRVRGGY